MCASGRMALNNKEEYSLFCERVDAPIFSQPWWMDAVCEPENWDVWLCRHGNEIVAAMPYYMEDRNGLRCITKAPLTQNNGIVFSRDLNATPLSLQKAEEKIINEACEFIQGLGLDIYEQQYHYSFQNWSPFFWRGFEALPRYTYVLPYTYELDERWRALSSKQRAVVKKGVRSIHSVEEVDQEFFYDIHKKVFERQGMRCPFSRRLWERLYQGCQATGQGIALCAFTEDRVPASFIFLVWDDRSVYQLLGGSTPELQNLDTYDALIWEGIKLAHKKGLAYDFEGSMIKRIAKSFREYGGTPKLYFRIRKVFNPEVILSEAQQKINRLEDK